MDSVPIPRAGIHTLVQDAECANDKIYYDVFGSTCPPVESKSTKTSRKDIGSLHKVLISFQECPHFSHIQILCFIKNGIDGLAHRDKERLSAEYSKLLKEYAGLYKSIRNVHYKLLSQFSNSVQLILHEVWPQKRLSRQEYIDFFENGYSHAFETTQLLLDKVGQLGSWEKDKLLEEEAKGLIRAREQFESDIAIGLSILDEAEAYYWIAFTLHPRRLDAFLDNKYIREKVNKSDPIVQAEIPLKLAARQFERHLRSSPQDVRALKRLVSCYRILGRADSLYKADIELKKAEAVTPPQVSRKATVSDRSGMAFEHKCYRLLSAMGFVANTTSVTNDGGIDIIATRNDPIVSGKYIVQCKDWQGSIGVKVVRELYGVVVSEDANKGILITSSQFTNSAVEFAQGKRIELIDGEQLDKIIADYMTPTDSTSRPLRNPAEREKSSSLESFCSQCGSTAKPGQRFCTRCGMRLADVSL